ncbi:MAG TPA: B12-binding domain-containing radical SAM protein [Candidatus Polarisedimenticolaceae bacterium]|nr:B12-binding domain-containing radical SAM protein [Candidatus Polarisedimenticolaceae bacterium]
MARKVLLLNPPGDRLYIRDQFCSHVSKGTYYWQPLDLLMIAARLHADGYELAVVDAIAERLAPEETQSRVERFGPEAIVFLTGSDSFAEDIAFVEEAKRRGVACAVGIGDILREKGEALMVRHPALDACLTDFVTHGLTAFLEGRREQAENMTVRDGSAIKKIAAGPKPRFFTIPSPPYRLFPLDRYRMPYNRYHPYATIITSTWCPFGCSYCPFARTPYRLREPDDVLRNLAEIHAMGIRQVHIADWTFAVDRRQATAIVQGILAADFGFTWSCLSRVDLMSRELMELMKRAGCDLIEFGVESGNQGILDRYDKGTTLEEIRRAFGWARELELDTLATFVLGLPGDTPETMQQTLDLALEIEPTFCSFNAASPRMGTGLRHEMIEAGIIEDRDEAILDSSRSLPVFSTDQLAAADVERFRRRAIRSFYLRPSYLARRLRRVASLVELQNHLGNGLSLAWQSLRSARAPRS